MKTSTPYKDEKEMLKKNPRRPQTQHRYMPAYEDVLPESTRRFPIVAQSLPEQICGVAHRIGWIGEGRKMQAIYRLKLRSHLASYGSATLPDFFVLENNVFVEYVQFGVQESK